MCDRTIVFDGAEFKTKHFCDDPCRGLRKKQLAEQKKVREKKLTADLNGGVSLGKSNKELTDRLRPLTLRSYGEVAAQMGLTPQAVRLIELRALNKIRAALLPFRNARNGAEKINQVCNPILSLED